MLRPSEADVRAQLARILGNVEFSVPERLRHFLSYVVEQALAGHADRIKAYSIAVEVFGRGVNFDIQNDPVVRIEAGRLRRALERYYLVVGGRDPILIEIPKGGYAPRFCRRVDHPGQAKLQLTSNQPEPVPLRPLLGSSRGEELLAFTANWLRCRWFAGVSIALMIGLGLLFVGISDLPIVSTIQKERIAVAGPSIIVRPFINLSGDPEGDVYAAGLSEEILAQLVHFKELTVFGRETSGAVPAGVSAPEIRRKFGNRFTLEGSVRMFDGRLRITSRVLDGATATVIWSDAYDADLRTSSIVDIEMSVASKVATAVAQPYGILFKQMASSRETRLPGSEAYQCSFRFYRYRTTLDAREHLPTRECLERMTTLYPDYATGWAMLAYLYLDEDRFDRNRRPGSPGPVERARKAAQTAVRLEPQNVRALQALMTVLFVLKDPAAALRVGDQALAINPNDTELLGEFGSRIAQAGEWKRGAALLEEAMARNPGHADYYVGILAFAAYMQNDDKRAVELIRGADLRRFPIYHLVAALIFARAGLHDEAENSRVRFLNLRPTFFDDFEGELDKRNFNTRDRVILFRAAALAGFPVKPHIADVKE
ncbi:adenylate cyclase [Bosea sp. CRIB-10]|uniref:adenylate cyclase n=1 Tax=Bosea sp. CRIB-10 TaxID=378404 RepID=UPI001FCE0298|nr:adenylate cyclase [Bosea sp. CRIB-10]